MTIRFIKFKRNNIQGAFNRSLTHIASFADAIERLKAELDKFEATLEEAHRNSEFFDKVLPLALREKALCLLGFCRTNPTHEALPYCLAAIDYLVRANDGQPDFEGLDGFDDDAEVLDRIIEEFGLENFISQPAAKKGA